MSSATLKSILLAATPGFLKPYWHRVESSPLGYRLAKGAFWSLLGTVLSRSLGVVASILVARMLGRTGMGELGIIQSTVGIFGAFAGLGMGLTATKFVAEHRVRDPIRAGAMLGLSAWVSWLSGIAMTLLMFLLAPWFAQHTLAAPHLSGLIRMGSLLLFLGSVNGAQTGALSGFEAFKAIARINLLSGLLNFPLMVGGALWFGLEGAVWGLIASQAVGCLLSHVELRREAAAARVPLRAGLQPGQINVLWRFSIPSVLCGALFGPTNWACSALLVNRQGGYGEMGIFNVTGSWWNLVAFLPGVLAQVILPLLASEEGAKGRGSQRKVVVATTKANVIAVLPLVLGVCVASPLIMACYGSGFREGWPALIVAVVTAGLLAVQTPAIQAITAAGQMWTIFLIYLSYSLVYVGTALVAVRWGALGLVGARFLAYAVNGVWVFWCVRRLFTLRTDDATERQHG
jgi:O-antigen/teichoic acid export membrane protein